MSGLLETIHESSGLVDNLSYQFNRKTAYFNCLLPLLNSLSWYGDSREIFEALPHFHDGLELTSFNKVMHELHYSYSKLKINLRCLDQRLLPCLFITNEGRVQVILEKCGTDIIIFDGIKNEKIAVEEYDCFGTAYKYEHIDYATQEKERIDASSIGRIIKRHKSLIWQTLSLSFLISLISLSAPLFIKVVYDKVIGAGSIPMLYDFVLGMVIAIFGLVILYNIRTRILSYIGVKIDNEIGNAIFSQIISLPSSYIESTSIGSQISKVKEFEIIREFFTGPLLTVFLELPFIILFIAVVGFLGASLVIVPCVMVLSYIILSYLTDSITKSHVRKTSIHNTNRQSFLIEALDNLSSVKLYGAESVWLERYKSLSAKSRISNYRTLIVSTVVQSIADAIMTVSAIAILVFGVVKVINGDITIGTLIAVMMLVWRILAPLKSIFTSLPRLDQIMLCCKQIDKLMLIKPENRRGIMLQPFEINHNNIDLLNVGFYYPGSPDPNLININMQIHAGEVTTITGPNGGGKSSLLKLIMRLYNPNTGGIRLGGKDIRQLDCNYLRKSIGYVPQEDSLFYGTIAQNLRLANPEATDQDLIQATLIAGVCDEIMDLPDGFETRIGDQDKNNLTCSFKQRLSLARAYIKKPPLLLLDEPTLCLDQKSVNQFIHTVNSLRGETTIIIVTHCEKLLEISDQIVFINRGRILSKGSPSEVLSKINVEVM